MKYGIDNRGRLIVVNDLGHIISKDYPHTGYRTPPRLILADSEGGPA